MSNYSREELYLGALLQYSPLEDNALIQKYKQTLDKADKYATAQQGIDKNKHSFVASPFENLKGKLKPNQIGFDFQALNLSDAFFPNDKPKKTGSVDKLWDNFKSDCNKYAQQSNPKLKAETILSLLQKYAITIPNPTAIHPEVSWYDYTKIKAGLAVCIYDYENSQEENKLENPLLIIRADISGIQEFIGNIASKNASKNLKGRSFYVQLLVNTVLKLMLKKLNLFEGNVMYASGGNFFVIAPNTQFVKDAFCEFEKEITVAIFKEHKTRIAVVMGYTEVSEKQIFNISEKIKDENGKDKYIEHGIDKAIVDLFTKVIDKKKKQKFSVLINDSVIDKDGLDGYDKFFNEQFGDNGGEQILDAITGEEVKLDKNGKYWVVEDAEPKPVDFEDLKDDDDVISEKTAKQIFIGSHLRKVDYWVVSEKQLPFSEKKRTEIFPLPHYKRSQLYHYLIKEKQLKKLNNFNNITIYSINDFKLEISPFFTLYGGNDVPIFEVDKYTELIKNKKGELEPKEWKKGMFKDFNHLALNFLNEQDTDGNQKTAKFKRLGVLKMDIDGLGSIFKNFVPYPNFDSKDEKERLYKRPHLTFSYYSALSRNLDWFFKGYLNTLWERDEFKHSTQIIYSGGDDLFIVGRWDAVTAFAKAIKEEFAKFTKNGSTDKTKQVTISGGVAIVREKFPIMKAADMASDAEHDAKDHKLEKENSDLIYKKDSFNFLKTSLNWGTEFKIVEDLKEEFVKHVGEDRNQIPKSFLGKIQIHAESAKQYNLDKKRYEDGKISNPPTPRWIWTIIYDFSRMADRLKVNRQPTTISKKVCKIQEEVNRSAKEFIRELSKNVFTNSWNGQEIKSQYHFLELLSVAARWAEIESRTNK